MLLYKIAHVVRDKLTCLWNFIELVNSWLFSIRFGSKLKSFCFSEILEGYRIVPIKDIATERMVAFFGHQPKEAFVFFTHMGLMQRVSNVCKVINHSLVMCCWITQMIRLPGIVLTVVFLWRGLSWQDGG